MKIRLFFLTVLLILSIKTNAQFSIQTEYDYLKLINYQQDKELIESSLVNAELAVNHIILEKNTKLNAIFVNELSQSNYIISNHNKTLYYSILQRVLFTNDSLTNTIKTRFYDSANKANLKKNEIDYLWIASSKNKLPQTKNGQIILCLNLGIKINNKKLDFQINKLGTILKKENIDIPIWYKDWEYITLVGIKNKSKLTYIDFNSKMGLFSRLNQKEKLKLYRKSINYYTKNHAFIKSKQTKKKYKEEKLPFFRKIGLFFRNLNYIYHKLI